MDWWFDTRILGRLQGIFLQPVMRTLQRGLNQMYQEAQKQDQRCIITSRLSNQRVIPQIRNPINSRITEDITKKVQSRKEYTIRPAFFMMLVIS